MKTNDLINILTEIEKRYKNRSIWSIDDLDHACPNDFTIELAKKIKKDAGCINGGKDIKRLKIYCDYLEVEGKENKLIDYDIDEE